LGVYLALCRVADYAEYRRVPWSPVVVGRGCGSRPNLIFSA